MIPSGTSESAAASGRSGTPNRDRISVADELGRRHQARRDVVTERQREREDRAGDEGRDDQRQDHPPERRQPAPAEIRRRLEEGVRDPLQARVDRQDHVRKPEIREDHPEADHPLAQPGSPEPHRREEPVEDPVLGQDQSPRIGLDEVTRPERHHDRHDHQAADPRRRDAGHVIGDREGEDHAGQRYGNGHPDRAKGHRPIERVRRDLDEVVERRLADDESGERVAGPERVQEKDRQGSEIGDDEPADRPGQEQSKADPRPPMEGGRQTARGGCRRRLLARRHVGNDRRPGSRRGVRAAVDGLDRGLSP